MHKFNLQTTYQFIASFFFFQAEDGIRSDLVTGVQTCALPISSSRGSEPSSRRFATSAGWRAGTSRSSTTGVRATPTDCPRSRSEERRVGKECTIRGQRDVLRLGPENDPETVRT